MPKPQNKKEEKLKLLLEEYNRRECMSIYDICEVLGCNRQSAYNYQKRLCDKGYVFHEKMVKNRMFYYLDSTVSNEPDTSIYEDMTNDTLRKYTILQQIQQCPLSRADLARKFTPYYFTQDISPEFQPHGLHEAIPLDIKNTSFYALLNELEDEQEIEQNPANNCYYATGKTVPLSFNINQDDLYDMYCELSSVSPGMPYYNELLNVYRKESLLLGDIEESTPSFENYVTYGRKMRAFHALRDQLDLLYKCDFKTKVLLIEYNSKSQGPLSTLFALGIIAYSVEKDAIYLIGENRQEKNETMPHIIINLSTVTKISDTRFNHQCYKSDYFQSVFDTMFSISVEPEQKVTVQFDCVANVERKINLLKAQRKYASVTKDSESNTLIYRDTIRGMSDFANYLRQFGKSVHILEPESLKNNVLSSAKLTLERYEKGL